MAEGDEIYQQALKLFEKAANLERGIVENLKKR
jgi:hypothetical protein